MNKRQQPDLDADQALTQLRCYTDGPGADVLPKVRTTLISMHFHGHRPYKM